jgi:hypothetical protein
VFRGVKGPDGGRNVCKSSVVEGFHKRMVGFKASTEENIVREKEQSVLFYKKNTRISHGLYDI